MAEEITGQEVKVILLALEGMIQDRDAVSKNPKYPFTPETRKDIKDILEFSRSAKSKLEKVCLKGKAFRMDPYQEGDEKEFLTKES